jgi:hypothetical protein
MQPVRDELKSASCAAAPLVEAAAFVITTSYATFACRRRIKMSPVCQLEMTLPGDFAGGVWGDGSADERWRAWTVRGAAGLGSAATDNTGGGAALGARAAAGISAVKGLPGRGRGRTDLEAARYVARPAKAKIRRTTSTESSG